MQEGTKKEVGLRLRVEGGGVCLGGVRQAHEALSDADGDTFAPEVRNCVV